MASPHFASPHFTNRVSVPQMARSTSIKGQIMGLRPDHAACQGGDAHVVLAAEQRVFNAQEHLDGRSEGPSGPDFRGKTSKRWCFNRHSEQPLHVGQCFVKSSVFGYTTKWLLRSQLYVRLTASLDHSDPRKLMSFIGHQGRGHQRDRPSLCTIAPLLAAP